jgi:hypothetical protein
MEATNFSSVRSNSDEVTLEILLTKGNTIRQGRSKNPYLGGYSDIENIGIDVKNATSGSTLQSVYQSGGRKLDRQGLRQQHRPGVPVRWTSL